MDKIRIGFVLIIFTLLHACSASKERVVPVVEAWQQADKGTLSEHHVQPGETLYSIAFRYGVDFRVLAAANHLNPPYALSPGSVLKMNGAQTAIHQAASHPVSAAAVPHEEHAKGPWFWPTSGPVFRGYGRGNKGIDIVGKSGQPIRATAAGEVVYSGDGLRGYGNLIIIKHGALYLSAYAHNRKNLVREGESVKAQQVIAEMGSTDAEREQLHFEIRKAGQPVNPLSLLAKKG